MTWSCEQIEARLSDYLDGALAAGEKAEYSAHLASCTRCAPLVESVGGMLGALHTMDPLPVPPLLAVKILDRTLGPHSEPQGLERSSFASRSRRSARPGPIAPPAPSCRRSAASPS